MKKNDSNLKDGVIILGLLIAIFIVITSSPVLKRNLSKNFSTNLNNIKAFVDDKLNFQEASNSIGYVETYKDYYDILEEALNNYQNSVTVGVKNYDTKIFSDEVYHKALENNPVATPGFSCTISTEKLGTTTMVSFQFQYPESRQVLLKKDQEVRAKVKDIVAEVTTPDMKDYEKEKALHDYLVKNCRYDERLYTNNMPEESYTAYSALINGVAVCQGYAIAMNLLLEEAGIESMIITGYGWNEENKSYISHGWNMVKIQGEYYHLDPTWNDPVMEANSEVVSYSYFNVTDDQMQKNHSWEKGKYPQCNTYDYTFNNIGFKEFDDYGNEIIVVKNYDSFSQAIKGDIIQRKPNVTYKILNFDNNVVTIEDNINKAYEEAQTGGAYSYYYNIDEMFLCGYVSIEFKWD